MIAAVEVSWSFRYRCLDSSVGAVGVALEVARVNVRTAQADVWRGKASFPLVFPLDRRVLSDHSEVHLQASQPPS